MGRVQAMLRRDRSAHWPKLRTTSARLLREVALKQASMPLSVWSSLRSPVKVAAAERSVAAPACTACSTDRAQQL